ncbi:hypothetical protein PT974_07761 [Cladobotryum mycophilum]|uniref:Uncharacterized protein n=1 Tax=Cladobotryum mycophilum TaxID=491253 RepID=A0ABR0SIQ6_9HYPO
MEDRLPSVREIQEPRFGTRFQKTMNAVQNCSTSKREEIPIAIIFAEFRTLDFLSRNLTVAPFRWAAKSLLFLEQPMEINLAFNAMNYMDNPLSLTGTCEDDGFHIQHPGFIFNNTGPTTIIRESIFLDTNDGKAYSLSLDLWDNPPQIIGPVERCALVFKTGICSDVIIAKIESNMVLETGTCYYVVIIGHGKVTMQPASEVHQNG